MLETKNHRLILVLITTFPPKLSENPKNKMEEVTKKTVFLFGAGASANAMPINNQLKDRLKRLASTLSNQFTSLVPKTSGSIENKELLNLLIKDLEWLAEKAKDHDTIDTFARYLHDNDFNEELYRLKLALVIFFELEPMTRDQNKGSENPDLDPRYLSFFEDIRPNASGPISGNYKILSWNYDTQLELGRLRHMDYNNHNPIYCLKDSIYALNIVFKHSIMISGNCDIEDLSSQMSMYKLNGVACTKSDELHALQNEIGKALTKDNIGGILLGYKNVRNKITTPTISYAWEEDTIQENNVVQLAIDAVKDAHFLVVIGYTFPEDNREIDNTIIKKMENLEKVYIQDFCPYKVASNFLKIRSDVEIELKQLKTGDEPFFVPVPAEKNVNLSNMPVAIPMTLNGMDIIAIY